MYKLIKLIGITINRKHTYILHRGVAILATPRTAIETPIALP